MGADEWNLNCSIGLGNLEQLSAGVETTTDADHVRVQVPVKGKEDWCTNGGSTGCGCLHIPILSCVHFGSLANRRPSFRARALFQVAAQSIGEWTWTEAVEQWLEREWCQRNAALPHLEHGTLYLECTLPPLLRAMEAHHRRGHPDHYRPPQSDSCLPIELNGVLWAGGDDDCACALVPRAVSPTWSVGRRTWSVRCRRRVVRCAGWGPNSCWSQVRRGAWKGCPVCACASVGTLGSAGWHYPPRAKTPASSRHPTRRLLCQAFRGPPRSGEDA